MNKDRTYKIGRRAELQELQKGHRINIDVLASAIKDQFEPRDPTLTYTEKIDVARLKVYMKEIERKSIELSKVSKELAMLNEELGVDTE